MRRSLELTALGGALFAVGAAVFGAREAITERINIARTCSSPPPGGCASCRKEPYTLFSRFRAAVSVDDYAFLTLGMAAKPAWNSDDVEWFLHELEPAIPSGFDAESSAEASRELTAAVVAWGIERGLLPDADEREKIARAVSAFGPAIRSLDERTEAQSP